MIVSSFFIINLPAAVAANPEYIYKDTLERPLKLYLTYPENWDANDNRPAIIFFFNGGWDAKGASKQFAEQAGYFARRGVIVVQADYREKDKTGVTSEKCMEDIFSAVRWMRANAETLGIDPNRISAAGGSGSGHLAASAFYRNTLLASEDDPSISPLPGALLLFNPDLDVLEPPIMQRMLSGSVKMPPTLVFYGTRDVSHTLIADFAAQTKNQGQPVEAFVGENAVHGFFKFSPWLEKTTQRADEFLQSEGLLDPEPRADLPQKTKPEGYDANVEANMTRWQERHEALAKARREKGDAPQVPDAAPVEKNTNNPKLAKLLQRFPEADINKDGELTNEEAQAYRSQMKQPKKAQGDEKPHPLLVPSRDWDLNKDGKLVRKEFKAPAILFDNLDYDDSGFLHGDELVKLDSKLDMSKTGDSIWSVPPDTQYHGVEHKTYFSDAMQTEVGYNIYFPDEYKTSQKHYPVIYHLHGSGGNESAQIDLSAVYHEAITAKKMSPVIIVFVNGGKRSYYCDSADGKIMSETTIIRELIPHIDTTYRTIPKKHCRVIHGFSMGGFGAMRLAAKYPELFCAVLSFGGGMAKPDSVHLLFLQHILGYDARLLAQNNPSELVMRNKSVLANMTFWLFSGTKDVALEDSTWAHNFLQSQQVPNRFEVSEDVGHTLKKHYTFFGDDIFQMLQEHFSETTLSSPPIEELKCHDAAARADAATTILKAGDSAHQQWPDLIMDLADDQRLDAAVAGYALFPGTPANNDISALIQALNFDTKPRTAAAWELSRIGPAAAEAAPALIEALESEDKHARNFAVVALAMVGPPLEAVLPLIEVMKDAGAIEPPQMNYHYPRASAALALGLMGKQAKEAVPALLDVLTEELSGWEYHRAAAAFALGEIGPTTKDAINALTRSLDDPCPIVQLWAAKALGKILSDNSENEGAKSVAELLKTLSSEQGQSTRDGVRKGLQVLASSDAAWQLVSKGARKQALPVHESIAVALGYLESLSNVPAPSDIDRQQGKYTEDVVHYFMALGGVQQGIVPALLEALGDEQRTARRSATKALGRIEEPSEDVLTLLEQALSDDDWMVRCAAAEALHNME